MREIYILALLTLVSCCSSSPIPPVTQLPRVTSHVEVTLSPDARIGNVTPDDISFVRKALTVQSRCQVDGPIIAIARDVVAGKDYLSVMTSRMMFSFVRDKSHSWKLNSCGTYNF